MNNSGAPFYYDYQNSIAGMIQPSELHLKNNKAFHYYAKYLYQKAMAIFEWKIPEKWEKNYFLYVLYQWGVLTVFNTDKFGVIPQACGLKGYNVFYNPTHAVVSNPLIRGVLELRIGKDCTMFRLQPDYSGIGDIVNYHAALMALAYESLVTNFTNSKLAFLAYATDKAEAESYKKIYDQIMGGVPAVVIGKNLRHEDGSPAFEFFNQDLSRNFIADRIMEAIRTVELHFDSEVGIPNTNENKRERLVTSEVNINNFETRSKAELWLDELQKACKQTREMFGIEISVDWRKELKEEYGGRNINPRYPQPVPGRV